LLTDAEIARQKPARRPLKAYAGGGLYLCTLPTGTRSWRLKYRRARREQTLTLGLWPAVSLAEAQKRADAARRDLAAGLDPRLALAPSRPAAFGRDFETVARAWHARRKDRWSAGYGAEVLGSLEADVFPRLGALDVARISPRMVLQVVRAIEARDAIDQAHRVRQRIGAIFLYAQAEELCTSDPAAPIKAALTPLVPGRLPALIDLPDLVTMLRKAEAEFCFPVTKAALRLLALTAVRPGEVRAAAWNEFEGLDGEAPLWRLSPMRMKTAREHVVPLAPAAVDLLRAMRPLTGRCPFVFPNIRHAHKPLGENAVGYLLNRAGYHGRHCPHGFRAAFSSIMNERHPADHDAIEAALAHTVPGVRGRYLRAPFLKRRRELAAEWADLILAKGLDAKDLLLGPRRR
jgi:integrase